MAQNIILTNYGLYFQFKILCELIFLFIFYHADMFFWSVSDAPVLLFRVYKNDF